MHNKQSMKTYSIDDMCNIPKNQGIYSFYLDLISPSKIGLIGNGGFDPLQLKRAKDLLLKKVTKYIKIARSDKLTGEMREAGKSDYISRIYSVIASGVSSQSFVDILSELPVENIYDYSVLSGMLSIFAQPIYVGISKEQTLYDRYLQHKYDFDNSIDESKFGVRAKGLGLDWDELLFCCVEINDQSNNNTIIRMAEKQMQAVSMPLLSIK
jgi:hypothetical protein